MRKLHLISPVRFSAKASKEHKYKMLFRKLQSVQNFAACINTKKYDRVTPVLI